MSASSVRHRAKNGDSSNAAAENGTNVHNERSCLPRFQAAMLQWTVASERPVFLFQQLCGVVPLQLVKPKHEEVPETPHTHQRIEHLPGAPVAVQKGTYTYGLLHWTFWLFACMGDELGYILLFPCMFWCVDFDVSRRMVFAWICMYYVGQSLKDVLQQPRPRPPVVQLEDHFATEFGFPSVHSVGAVGLLVYMARLFDARDTSGDPAQAAMRFYTVTFVWVMICFSRAYMGVHSLLDIVGGILIGWGCRSLVEHYIADPVDLLVMSGHPWFGVLHPLFWIFMLWMYPRPPFFTAAFGTCCLVVGTGVGVLLGCWLRIVLPFYERWVPDQTTSVNGFYRMVIGSCALGATRQIVKSLCHMFLRAVLPPTPVGHKFVQRYAVDGPTKFVTYGSIGMMAILVVPQLFMYFQV